PIGRRAGRTVTFIRLSKTPQSAASFILAMHRFVGRVCCSILLAPTSPTIMSQSQELTRILSEEQARPWLNGEEPAMASFIFEANIAHYKRLLASETDATKIAML